MLWILLRILERIPGRFLRLRILYFFKFTGEDTSRLRARFPGTIRWGGRDDLPGIVACAGSERTEMYLNRLHNGDKCIVAIDKQGVTRGYGWLTVGNRHKEDRTGCVFEFPERSIYAYNIYVTPEYRLSGVWVGFMQLILGSPYYNASAGLHCFIAYGNTASLKPHLRYGFSIYERKTIFSVFGRPIIFSSKMEHNTETMNRIVNEG